MAATTMAFTPAHRGGRGTPMVCLHGFTDTWRTWEPVLPALEREHDVLAPTLAGHAGGPPLPEPLTVDALPDAVERAMDAAGLDRAHLVGDDTGHCPRLDRPLETAQLVLDATRDRGAAAPPATA